MLRSMLFHSHCRDTITASFILCLGEGGELQPWQLIRKTHCILGLFSSYLTTKTIWYNTSVIILMTQFTMLKHNNSFKKERKRKRKQEKKTHKSTRKCTTTKDYDSLRLLSFILSVQQKRIMAEYYIRCQDTLF